MYKGDTSTHAEETDPRGGLERASKGQEALWLWLSKPGDGNVTDRESNPCPLGRMIGDSTTRLKRSAVMSGTGIHRLVYRDICVERGVSYAACAAHNNGPLC